MTAEVFDPEVTPDPAAGTEDGTDQATEPSRPVPGPPGARPRLADGPATAPTPADLAATAPATAAPASTAGPAARQVRSGPDGRAGRQNGRPVPGRPTSGPPARPVSGAGTAGDDRETERGLRGLVGSGSSQVSVGAAMRARDANRPTEADLAQAEEHLVIVRRNWQPREDLPRNR